MNTDNKSSTKKCTKPWRKRQLPSESHHRTCEHCQNRDKENQRANQAQKKDAKTQCTGAAATPLETQKRRSRDLGVDNNMEEHFAARRRTENGSVSVQTPDENDDNDKDEYFDQEPDEEVSDITLPSY
jgi:hypothetical protein